MNDNRILKVSSGVITTVAGTGTRGFSGDNGPATSAQLFFPGAVAVDSAGNLYILDTLNNRLRKVSNGVITTVAGGGASLGDNVPATSAQLGDVNSIAVDTTGNVYIAESSIGSNRIRKISNGVISTVAGGGVTLGDNGLATSAQLSSPGGVTVDSADNLYIADSSDNRIRKVSNGVITTVAGDGNRRFGGDNGPATSAQLNVPLRVAVDSAGNLYITEADYRIRKVSNGVITTIAGTGTPGFSGDNGPATSAQLNGPGEVAVDSTGNVYFSDVSNERIRVLTPSSPSPPSLVIKAVSNGASNLNGSIAPGEIVVLYGSGLGPTQLASFHVDSAGNVDTQLAGTTVSFNGLPAPIIYTSMSQVAAIVPYGVSGVSAQVAVTYQSQTSTAATVNVAPSAPALFTLDSTGKGQAAAVNLDGSINTAGHPAPIGSIISLYATGEGQTSPAGVDGKPAQTPLPRPLLPVTVTIGGQTVTPQYAGGAPVEVAGVMQINVQIPSGITSGNAVPITIQVGSTTSQGGVTIAVAGN